MSVNLQTPVRSEYFMMFAFPPLYVVEYPHDLSAIQEAVDDLEFRQSQSNFTTSNQYILELESFSKLKEFCLFSVQKYTADVILNPHHEIGIQQSWANKTVKGTEHPKHYHLNSMISGVFYVRSSDDAPPIVFDSVRQDPFPVRPEPDRSLPSNEFTNDSYTFKASAGHLLLFPSILHHYVPMHTGDEPRISISFNTFPMLPVGSYDASTLLT